VGKKTTKGTRPFSGKRKRAFLIFCRKKVGEPRGGGGGGGAPPRKRKEKKLPREKKKGHHPLTGGGQDLRGVGEGQPGGEKDRFLHPC